MGEGRGDTSPAFKHTFCHGGCIQQPMAALKISVVAKPWLVHVCARELFSQRWRLQAVFFINNAQHGHYSRTITTTTTTTLRLPLAQTHVLPGESRAGWRTRPGRGGSVWGGNVSEGERLEGERLQGGASPRENVSRENVSRERLRESDSERGRPKEERLRPATIGGAWVEEGAGATQGIEEPRRAMNLPKAIADAKRRTPRRLVQAQGEAAPKGTQAP